MQTQTPAIDQLVGQTVGGCRVQRLLGRGRLSAVYLAQHPVRNGTVALTTFIIPEHFSAEARSRFRQRFANEALTLTTLHHNHLLPIHDYGEQFGYPYLVTPYMADGSLANVLKQQGRCTPDYVLNVLEQIASGLECIHRKGVFHGSLKPSNILLHGERTMLVAGFGLMQLLQMRGIEQRDQPYAHLLSIADTFLYSSAYIAPEVVQGQFMDARSDIYALGVMLFELLSGKLPFVGTSPLDTAIQHVQSPLPALHTLCPDIPIALELVVKHALERDPSQRFQRVGEVAEAFAQVCRGLVNRPVQQHSSSSLMKKFPMTSSLHDVPEEDISVGNWQLMPPIITGKNPAISRPLENSVPLKSARSALSTTDSWQLLPPIVSAHMPVVKSDTQAPITDVALRSSQPVAQPVSSTTASSKVVSLPTLDLSSAATATPGEAQPPMKPLAGSSTNQLRLSNSEQALPSSAPAPALPPSALAAQRFHPGAKRSRGVGRRKVLATLAAGSVVAAGTLFVVNPALRYLFGSAAHSPAPQGGTMSTQTPQGNTDNGGHIVGATNLPANSAISFDSSSNGKASLLIHLPNGRFVAYGRACTHEGVAVNYDSAMHMLVCPAHGSIFDPAHGAKVLQGPATTPLAGVTIRVNADGTITTA